MKNSYLLYSILFLLALSSCKKFEDVKIAKTAWNPNVAVPIGYASFGVYDILASQDSTDLIIIDPVSGEIALNYSSQVASFDASQVAQLGNISQNFTLNLTDLNIPVSVGFNGNANAIRTEILTLAAPNGEEIHTVFFKNGLLDLHFETTLRHNLNVTLTFLDITQNGSPITQNFAMNFSGTTPQTQDIQVNLAEALADFTNNGSSVNETRIQIQVSVLGTGQPVAGNEDFTLSLNSSNLAYHNITGYIGQQTVANLSDSVLLRVFETAVDGTFELTNPKVTFTIDNSFGFPLDLNLNNLSTININTGQTLPLLSYPQTININAPTVIGQSEVSTFVLDKNNTQNISSIISPTPKYFYYEIDGQSNPNGQTANLNFVDENSICTIKTEVEMPLEGFAYGFKISDTIEFTQFDNSNVDLIDFIMFRLIVDNGFPVRLGTQITAIDENGVALFSLFDQPQDIVTPAPVDAAGKVTQSTRKITDMTLTDAQIALLSQAKKLIVYGEASTTNSDINEIVKFYDTYKIDIKLALQVQAQTQF